MIIIMDDNKINPEENQSFDVAQDKSFDSTQDKPTPIFESVPEENLKPEEVAPEVVAPTGEEMAPEASGTEIPTDVPPVVYEENKSKYFIVVGGAIFFLLILLFFLRVFFGKKAPAKEIKLAYWGLWEEKEVFTSVIEDYQRKNPGVKINYQKMSAQDYRDKLLARSKNGQGPDLFRFHNTWLPEIKDVVVPIPQNIMSNSEFEKTFYKIQQKDLKVGNFYYGIPLTLDGLVLVYNDSLFKQAGIATPPSTWDDLTDSVIKLTVKDTDGQLVTEPPNNFWDETMPNSVTAFSQEKVAMIFVPSWEILTIKNSNPDLQLKVVPVPSVPGGSPISIANYWVEGVSRYSKNQLEAWKFLRFLSEKDTLTKLYEIESKNRLFGEPYSRVDLGTLLAQNEYVGAIIKQADSYVSLPLISRTFDNGLNDEIIQYLENAVNSTVQGVAYADALQTAKQGVDQVFSKYKIE